MKFQNIRSLIDTGLLRSGKKQVSEQCYAEPQKVEPQKVEPQKVEPQKVEPQKVEPQKVEPQKVEPQKVEPQKGEPQKGEPQKGEPQKGEPQDVTGFVESIDLHEISGWAVSKAGQREFVLELDGREFKPSVTWQERADVTEALECDEKKPGFVALIPRQLRSLLGSDLGAVDRLVAYMGQEKVERSDAVRIIRPTHERVDDKGPVEGPIEYGLSDYKLTAIDGKLRIENIEAFTIHGTILGVLEGEAVDADAIEVWCGGEKLESAVILGGDPDDPAAASQERDHSDQVEFEVELPGYMWEHDDEDGCCRIELAVAGVRVSKAPLCIKRDHARQWINDIVDGYFGERQYWPLLALEHMHFLGSDLKLDDKTSSHMRSVAETYNLDQFLPGSDDALVGATEQESEVDTSTLIVWRALHEFNESLPQWTGREYELLLKVFSAFGLVEEQRIWLILSLVPYFCRIGSFPMLLGHVPQTRVRELLDSQEAWKVTTGLPFLAVEGNVLACTETLWRLSECDGWVNSECVNYTTRRVVEDSSDRTETKSVEGYGYSLIGLLRNMQDDYWSRLHDVNFVEALALFFDDAIRWGELFTKDLAAEALRLYGLSPHFWQYIDESRLRKLGGCDELLVGKERFERLRRAVSRPVRAKDALLDAWPCLEFFQRYQNPEAAAAERELICGALPFLSRDQDPPEYLNPVMALSALTKEDALRVAAFPLRGQNAFTQQVPNLPRLVRSMTTMYRKAPRYAMQKNAAELLEDLLASIDTVDANGVAEKMQPILLAARGLVDQTDLFLGVDVLATAYSIVQEAEKPGYCLMDSIRHHSMKCIENAEKQEWPPVALMTLASALGQARSRSGYIGQSLYAELLQKMQQRYTSQLADLKNAFEVPADLARRHSPGRDALVVIYSCQKYLPTRISKIRETWAADLKAKGIPYVVLVGDGQDTLEGDVLALDVPDRYEDLPKKTLKLVEWVVQNTDFQFLIKIDDDCYLNVDEYFDTLSYRKYHYQGRIIEQSRGGMDRVWHQSKAQGRRARRALEKSPEPARWVDGGSGYSLSRLAMQVLLSTANTPVGRRLIHSSFMEDKLVGDLLGIGGIGVSDEDHYTLVRRRTFDLAMPVARWANNFFCSAITPTKLVHLDTEQDMKRVESLLTSEEVWPKKIWPSYSPPSLWFKGNQLELLTPMDKAATLLDDDLMVVAVVRNEKVIIPHFLEHYRRLGVSSFVFVDNLSDDGTREILIDEPDVVLYSADTEYRHSHYGVAWQQAILANHCLGKWVLLADADEFLVYPNCESLPLSEYVREIDAAGHDAVSVLMVDMYPYGDLADADFRESTPFEAARYFDSRPVTRWYVGSGHYSNSKNHTSALRHRKIPDAEPNAFTSQKYCLLKYAPWMKLSEGLHSVGEISAAPETATFAHFKYHSEFKEKVETEIRRKQHFDGAKEYAKYQAMLVEGSGGFGDRDVSRGYEDSGSFADISASHSSDGKRDR